MITHTNQLSAEARLYEIFKGGKHIELSSGQVITRPEDPIPGIFYIEQGYVKVYSLAEDGREMVILFLKAGEIFSLQWLFDGVKRNIYYSALGDVHLLRISQDTLTEMVKRDTDLLVHVCRLLAHNLRLMSDAYICLTYPNAQTRILAWILYMGKRVGVKRGTKVTIRLPITQEDIASALGITRETVSRGIAKLVRDGDIEYRKRTIIIGEYDRLAAEMPFKFIPGTPGTAE